MKRKPTALELKVFHRLWDLGGGGTVHQVLDAWADGKAPRYTTVLKMLQIMEEKGFVTHEKQGRSYRYAARLRREDMYRTRIDELLRVFFKGDSLRFVNALVEEMDLSIEEIRAIRRMLSEKAKEKKS